MNVLGTRRGGAYSCITNPSITRTSGERPTPFKIAAVVMNEVSLLCDALIDRTEPMIRMVARVARYGYWSWRNLERRERKLARKKAGV